MCASWVSVDVGKGILPDSESTVVAEPELEHELTKANMLFSSAGQTVSLEDFELISVIGKGTFGKVWGPRRCAGTHGGRCSKSGRRAQTRSTR